MHELSITRNIVAIVSERARGRRVRALQLRIGALSGIDVPAVRACYALCVEGTPLDGSRLDVEEVPGAARCRGCAAEIPLSAPLGVCPCERRALLDRTSGDELLIASMEVEDV